MLGFLELPKNQLVTRAEYTPSKVGGHPAWIAPKGLPPVWCQKCEYKLTFLMQLYACIDEAEFDDFHRMLYVFVCLSDKCIGTQNAVQCFRGMIPHHNSLGVVFKTDDEVNSVFEKSNN